MAHKLSHCNPQCTRVPGASEPSIAVRFQDMVPEASSPYRMLPTPWFRTAPRRSLSKLYMILGQIYEEFTPPQLDKAAKAYEKGIAQHTRSVPLWLCAAESGGDRTREREGQATEQ